MNALFSSHATEAALFAAVTVFTVVSLEIYRVWLERGAEAAAARIFGAWLGIVFLCLAGAGIVDYAIVGKPDFINLGFFLNGAAGLGILPGLYFQRGAAQELRRMNAHDL